MRHQDLVGFPALQAQPLHLFGPIFQVVYVPWLVVGGIIGFFIGIFAHQGLGNTIEDVAYYDNPWETWAYKQEGPTPSAHHGGDFSWA